MKVIIETTDRDESHILINAFNYHAVLFHLKHNFAGRFKHEEHPEEFQAGMNYIINELFEELKEIDIP